jgi:PHD/YefM family antitoxin component YafN of YafNO toxin-antitoxin module
MAIPKPRFIVDDRGEKTAVILDMSEYKRLLEEAEELEAIRAYDAAKAAGDEAIPFEQAVTEIERKRK